MTVKHILLYHLMKTKANITKATKFIFYTTANTKSNTDWDKTHKELNYYRKAILNTVEVFTAALTCSDFAKKGPLEGCTRFLFRYKAAILTNSVENWTIVIAIIT